MTDKMETLADKFALGVPLIFIGLCDAGFVSFNPERTWTGIGRIMVYAGGFALVFGMGLLFGVIYFGIYRALWFFDRARKRAEP